MAAPTLAPPGMGKPIEASAELAYPPKNCWNVKKGHGLAHASATVAPLLIAVVLSGDRHGLIYLVIYFGFSGVLP